MVDRSSPVSETAVDREGLTLIDKRLSDLREANEIFRKSSWNRESDIHRNDREIRWLIDLRTVLLADHAQTQQQWRPIETAPKDGTIILICGNGSGGYYVSDVKWDGDWLLFDVSSDDWTEPTFAVSHWMPLPEPPALSVSSTVGNSK